MSVKADRSVYLLRVQTQASAPWRKSLTETKGRAALGRGRHSLGDAKLVAGPQFTLKEAGRSLYALVC